MTFFIIYLIGIIVASYIIAKAIYKNSDEEEEYSGYIICYCFAILSWVVVFIVAIGKLQSLIKKPQLTIPNGKY